MHSLVNRLQQMVVLWQLALRVTPLTLFIGSVNPFCWKLSNGGSDGPTSEPMIESGLSWESFQARSLRLRLDLINIHFHCHSLFSQARFPKDLFSPI